MYSSIGITGQRGVVFFLCVSELFIASCIVTLALENSDSA